MSSAIQPVEVPTSPKAPHQTPAARPGAERRGRIKWLVLLAVVGVGVIAWLMLRSKPQAAAPVAVVKTATASVGPLDVTLRMTGVTSARNFVNITAPLLRGPE